MNYSDKKLTTKDKGEISWVVIVGLIVGFASFNVAYGIGAAIVTALVLAVFGDN